MLEHSKHRKILVVDDDPFMREVLCQTLIASDYVVFSAENGAMALAHDSLTDLNLIILDINMPVMNGIETIKKLRDANHDVPVIVLMTNSEVTFALEAISAGADDYLLKDNNTQDMIVLLVERALARKQLTDQNRQLLEKINGMVQSLERVVSKMTEIGTALSSEKDFPKLLEMIVSHARTITNADAGTLYLVEDNQLHFAVIQNKSLGIQMGGRSKVPYPPVAISESSVSGYVALMGETLNIPDVYTVDIFDFTGPKKFDVSTGYRSKSMLVLPLKNHESEVVGVLQLLNAINPETGEVIAFSREAESLAESIASQAAVAITNTLLANDMEKLFDAFVEVMATAIDEKSPVTGGHIRRMTDLALTIANEINKLDEGPLKGIYFNAKQMHQLRIAALMHDIGKVTTPTEIMEKGKKLEAIIDRVHLVQLRIRYAAKLVMLEGYKRKLYLVENGATQAEIYALDKEMKQKAMEFDDIIAFVGKCNEPGEFLADDKLARLKVISKMTYEEDGEKYPLLTESEIENLSIRKGSITEKERKKMQDHAIVTVRMLKKIPFPKNLKDVPRFAGAHHEQLNGKGYPLGLKGDEIPFEGRLLAVADIAEALTATDRPYKKAMPLEMVYKVLRSMVGNGELDPCLVELFIEKNIYGQYKNLDRKDIAPSLKPILYTEIQIPYNGVVAHPVRRDALKSH